LIKYIEMAVRVLRSLRGELHLMRLSHDLLTGKGRWRVETVRVGES
jgi:hypothetical protein